MATNRILQMREVHKEIRFLKRFSLIPLHLSPESGIALRGFFLKVPPTSITTRDFCRILSLIQKMGCPLKDLLMIEIDKNKLTVIPDEIRQCKNLRIFSACGNSIKFFPADAFGLSAQFDLTGNPVTKLEVKSPVKKAKIVLFDPNKLSKSEEVPPEAARLLDQLQTWVSLTPW